ncbi:MAG: hypothetical protein WBG46_10925 [Nonlabens sp.]
MSDLYYKILKAYILGVFCIVCFVLLENSSLIPILIEKTKDSRYNGFATFYLIGLVKYGLLVAGMGVILIFTILLIWQEISTKS